MAIIKLGQLVAGIRGTINGVVYSQNKSGCYAKGWSRGSNPQTVLQQTVRGSITGLGSLWGALSEAERALWDAFAAAPPEEDVNSLGDTVYLSGWQWFCRVNQRRASVLLPATTDVPSDVAVSPVSECSLDITFDPEFTVVVSWGAGEIPAGYSVLAFCSVSTSAGTLAAAGRPALILARNDPSSDVWDITSAILGRFGALRPGWRLFATVYRLRDDGVRSIGLSCNKLVP